VDCVERNGAKLAQPRTVLEMDQESLLPRLMTGLLPAPGATSGSEFGLSMMGYGSRNGSGGGGVPITVQVVDSVEVTAVPVGGSSSGGSSSGGSSNGAAAGGKDGAAAAAKGGSSSNKGGGNGGGSSGGGNSSSSRPGSAGGSGSSTATEQQQQQLQPSAAAAGVAYAAAGGTRLDAAGMAAGANAQRKGEQLLFDSTPSTFR
jgi:hypothetical protein